MKARIIKAKGMYWVQKRRRSLFSKWKDATNEGFYSAGEAENWIIKNLFAVDFEVIAVYTDNTKQIEP